MSPFHEILLPLPFSLAARGGPERRVDVVTLGSGAEARNTPWALSRRSYDIGGAARTLDDLAQLIAFFEARRGKLIGFRFRDFLDCKSCLPQQTPTVDDVEIGVGDGDAVSFQLVKRYGDGEDAVVRPIKKPVAGSVVIAVDGAALGGPDFSVDATTGIVTLDAAPADGAIVTAGFQFDTPVRFDLDRLDITLDGFGAGHALTVPLIEILI